MREVERGEYLRRLDAGRDRTDIVKVITGMRRCGKSTLMRQYMELLRRSGVPSDSMIYLNFESESTAHIVEPMDITAEIRANTDTSKRIYVFLDEVQRVKGWELAVNALQVDMDADVYITGSNAFLLSGELSTYLSGRYVEIDMFPLSFKEFLDLHGGDAHEMFGRYLDMGSLPAVGQGNDEEFDRQVLAGIFNTVLMKDVLGNVPSSKAYLLTDISRFLYSNIGNTTSCNNIAVRINEEFRDVRRYVDALQKAFLFYKAERFDIRGLRLLDTQEKYYASDTGMRNVILDNSSWEDTGRLVENVVFLELRRRGYEVHVGKYGDSEVDFVARRGGSVEYYQVTVSMASKDVYERELRPLRLIKDSYPKTVLSLDRFLMRLPDGISHVNVVSWLLGEESKPTRKAQATAGRHPVQKWYLDNFSNKGRIYCYNVRERNGFYGATSDLDRLDDYYEARGHVVNGLDDRLAGIEMESIPYLQRVIDGEAVGYEDLRWVLRYAGIAHVRSPAFQYCSREMFRLSHPMGDVDVDVTEDEMRDRRIRAMRDADSRLYGFPHSELGCMYVTWGEDTLIAGDNPVIPCNLYDISKRRHLYTETLDGFLFPMSPRTLFIVFHLRDLERVTEEFCDSPGRVNPVKVNGLMAEAATELVFYRDRSNPVFDGMEAVIPNEAVHDIYDDLRRARQGSDSRREG